MPIVKVVLEQPPLADAMLITAAIGSPPQKPTTAIPRSGHMYKCVGIQMGFDMHWLSSGVQGIARAFSPRHQQVHVPIFSYTEPHMRAITCIHKHVCLRGLHSLPAADSRSRA